MKEHPIFDHEKLDVYQIELSFVSWVTILLHEIKTAAGGFHREVCDQLDRASLSALLNTAEGNGKRQGKQRAKFFDDARGSAVECAACLDALVAKGLTGMPRVVEGKAMLLRIVGMLTRLVARFDESLSRGREDNSCEGTEDRPRPSFSCSSSFPPSSPLLKSGRVEDEGRERERGGGGRGEERAWGGPP